MMLTVGTTVSMQYCCGEIASLELYAPADPCCGSEDEVPGCCREQVLIVQFDEQQAVSNGNIFKFSPPAFHLAETTVSLLAEQVENQSQPVSDPFISPPSERPLWLLKCSLIYYG